MDWSRSLPIVAALVAVPLAMKMLASNRGRPPPGEVRYSTALKVLALGMTLVPTLGVAFLAAFVSPPRRPDDQIAVAGLIGGFLALGSPLVLEFFRVRHTFDGEQLAYRSPWTRARSLRWADATRIRWRASMKWLEIRDAHGQRFLFSPLLGGLDALAIAARQHLPPAALEASPDGAAVLELMRRGHVLGLVMSQVTPEMQVRDLPPEPPPQA